MFIETFWELENRKISVLIFDLKWSYMFPSAFKSGHPGCLGREAVSSVLLWRFFHYRIWVSLLQAYIWHFWQIRCLRFWRSSSVIQSPKAVYLNRPLTPESIFPYICRQPSVFRQQNVCEIPVFLSHSSIGYSFPLDWSFLNCVGVIVTGLERCSSKSTQASVQ